MATDLIKLKAMAEDTVRHKEIVMEICLVMSSYLMENNKITLAIELLRRGAEHDNSKFSDSEFRKLASILKSEKCFVDADYKLSNTEKKAINEHWKNNRHHPEYFNDPSEMSELDVIEMVCDWFARSVQYGTEFIPFILERQKNRFHFSEKQFKTVLKYCNIIQERWNKQE